jgi:exodeoxyribonuclease-3
MNVKIFSYNINGLRAAINKGFDKWLAETNPDIICLQEIKATPDQIDLSLFEKEGYSTYWYPAEKKGYSGTALFTRVKPDLVIYGIGNEDFDKEGRNIRTDFADITHITSYFPSGTTGELRQSFKMDYLNYFYSYIRELVKVRPNIIVSGDLNIAHKDIDINFPQKHLTSSGFLPEERAWVDKFLNAGFIDSFRVFNNQPKQYSWWTYRAQARAKNLGWRIDYHLVSNALSGRLKSAGILSEVVHSDHCPVSVELDF